MNKVLYCIFLILNALISYSQDLSHNTRFINLRGDTFNLKEYRSGKQKLILIFSSGQSCSACKESIGQYLNDSLQIDSSRIRIIGVAGYVPSFQYMRQTKATFRGYFPNMNDMFFYMPPDSVTGQKSLPEKLNMKQTPCMVLIDPRTSKYTYLSYKELFNYVSLSAGGKKRIREFVKK